MVICVRVNPPWGGMPLALPIAVRLHQKGGATMPELAAEMMVALAVQLPGASFVLCADGAYATLAGAGLQHRRRQPDASRCGPLLGGPAQDR